LERVKGIEPST